MKLKDKVIAEIKKIYDPEIPVNIYELGLIYDIIVDDKNNVKINMTLTTPNCPVAESLPNEVKNIPTVCGSLREAMESLDRDRGFLKQGGVFSDDQIDAFIALKFEEIYNLEHTPHPMEFEMYYSS